MGHWSLRIKSVRDDDRGLYECQLSIHPTQSIFIELKVVGEYFCLSNIYSNVTNTHTQSQSQSHKFLTLVYANEHTSWLFGELEHHKYLNWFEINRKSCFFSLSISPSHSLPLVHSLSDCRCVVNSDLLPVFSFFLRFFFVYHLIILILFKWRTSHLSQLRVKDLSSLSRSAFNFINTHLMGFPPFFLRLIFFHFWLLLSYSHAQCRVLH